MRKTRTRILSLLLALVMCLGLLPVTALAAGGSSGEPALFLDPEDTNAGYYLASRGDFPGGRPSPDEIMGNVTFILNGAGENQTVSVKYGDTRITPPEDPTLPGYRFLGWYIGTVGSDQYLHNYYSIDHCILDWALPVENPTFYAMWEKEGPSGFTITFDPNGGTVSPTTKQTDADGQVPGGYPTPTRDGYTFLGWFTDGDDYKPAENEKWGGNQTLVAKWEKTTEAVRVNFYPNGGKISKFKGKTVPAPNGGYPFTVDDVTGVDMKSGIGWTNTEDSGLLTALPSVEREGYTFDGWYFTATGPEANQAYDGKLTDFSKLTPFDPSKKISGSAELAAKWVASGETYTVKFNLYGMPGTTPSKQEISKGGTVKLPEVAVPDRGIEFVGWCTLESDNRLHIWDAKNPVTHDLTLYAGWRAVRIPSEDTFQFSNSSRYFNDYKITEAYLEYLEDNISWRESIRREFYGIPNVEEKEWGGSCFGMSAVYCMAREKQFNPGTFQSGISLLWDLQAPNESQNVQDLINFYMMAQKTYRSYVWKLPYYEKIGADRNQAIVNSLQETGAGFTLLGFTFGPGYGHAIVARRISKGTDNNYHIEIWDPNYPSTFGEMIISSDCSHVRFGDKTMNSEEYNLDPTLLYDMPLSKKSSNYDAKNLESVFGKLGSASSQSAASNIFTLFSSTGNFSIAASDGRTAVVKNGEQVSGNLRLLRDIPLMGTSGGYRYIISTDTLEGLTVTLNGEQAEVEFVSNDILARASANGLKSMEVSGDTVTTACTSSAQQEITMVSTKLGDTWNKVTVSGKDTGFTVSAENQQLKVSSNNNVNVTVQGENMSTWKTSGKQSITASSSGTTVAMNTLGTDTQQPSTPANTKISFPDVAPTAWYAPAVAFVSANGYMVGNADGTFNPDGQVRGTEFAQILYNKEGKPAAADSASFKGVTDQWYAPAILWAAGKGIITDAGDTAIVPTASLTRQQIALMLYNYMGKPVGDADLNKFSDADKISDWAVDAVKWAVSEGIFKGNADGTFNPTGTAKRSETAQILMNFFG